MSKLIRSHFDHDLLDLQRSLITLAARVQATITRASRAVLHRDAADARWLVRGDREINEQRYLIEEQGQWLLARQQPLAGDLRAVGAYTAIAGELERMGDYTKGIGKIALRIVDCPPLGPPPALRKMASLSAEMLDQAMRAVVERDAGARAPLERADDDVDQLYAQLFEALVGIMRTEQELIGPATLLLWAAHNFERLADRTVNIAERAAIMADGRRLDQL